MPSDPRDPTHFSGGVHEVRRVGDTVVRPAGAHTPTIHSVLAHLRSNGFTGGPEPIALDPAAGTETLTWMNGEVTETPFEQHPIDPLLVSAGQLLRQLHDASTGFPSTAAGSWYIAAEEPAKVLCHGDFAPYNCTIMNGEVVGVFDFDTAHPGPRLSDLGYAAYRWVPLDPPADDDPASLAEQRRRLHLFRDAYDASISTDAVLDHAIISLERMVRHITDQAVQGHEAFQRHLDEGHDVVYENAIRHLSQSRGYLV